MSERVDVAVIGASYAGLSCAHRLLDLGLRVALFDKRADLRDKVHTTGIVVDEAAEEWDLAPEHLLPVNRVNLYSPSLHTLELEHPDYFFQVSDVGEVWNRKLDAIRDHENLRLFLGKAFTDVRLKGRRYGVEGTDVEADFLVGADGPKSQVAKVMGLGINRRFLVGAELELDSDPQVERFHCFLHDELCAGYIGWLIPGPRGLQVGLACGRRRKINLDAFIEHIAPVYAVDRSKAFHQKAGIIPVGGLVDPIYKDHVLLVGDAAGTVSPLTGGGIHTAMRYGRLAADSIAAFLSDGDEEAIRAYHARLPRFGFKHALRWGFERFGTNALLNAGMRLPGMGKVANQVFFGRKRLA